MVIDGADVPAYASNSTSSLVILCFPRIPTEASHDFLFEENAGSTNTNTSKCSLRYNCTVLFHTVSKSLSFTYLRSSTLNIAHVDVIGSCWYRAEKSLTPISICFWSRYFTPNLFGRKDSHFSSSTGWYDGTSCLRANAGILISVRGSGSIHALTYCSDSFSILPRRSSVCHLVMITMIADWSLENLVDSVEVYRFRTLSLYTMDSASSLFFTGSSTMSMSHPYPVSHHPIPVEW